MVKIYKTLMTYMSTLLDCGLKIKEVVEPMSPKEMLDSIEGIKNELLRQ